jgi:hypothetical protein
VNDPAYRPNYGDLAVLLTRRRREFAELIVKLQQTPDELEQRQLRARSDDLHGQLITAEAYIRSGNSVLAHHYLTRRIAGENDGGKENA